MPESTFIRLERRPKKGSDSSAGSAEGTRSPRPAGGEDQIGYLVRGRDHRQTARRALDGFCSHAFRQEPFTLERDYLILCEATPA